MPPCTTRNEEVAVPSSPTDALAGIAGTPGARGSSVRRKLPPSATGQALLEIDRLRLSEAIDDYDVAGLAGGCPDEAP
jgi:hypothetical protein